MFRVDAKPKYRYEQKSGKFVSGSTYASKLETAKITRNYITAKKAELIELGSLFHQQKITAADFRVSAAQILKSIHIANASLAKHLTPDDMKTITKILEEQFYSGVGKDGKPFGLKLLIDDATSYKSAKPPNGVAHVLKGKVSEAQLRNRLRMYGEAGQISFSAMERGKAIAQRLTQERRIRKAEHSCMSCIAYEMRGWVPIGTLPHVGQQCECLSNCQCIFEYR